ncbi:hypothetical protein HDU86_004531 [Geranomyces michiganensis]|nr:hypothetical protein HDU86_004531 [Geranomyces michiganensis]
MTDSDTSATGGGDRKRPGAKKNPFIFDMAAHRKEKNRQAQKALRERRSQQALETQTELRALRSQVASLGHDRSLLRHENRQMQNLLALTISGWIPEVGQEMAKRSSHDDMMIAAKALAELGAGPIYEPSAQPQLPAGGDHQGSMSPHVHDSHHLYQRSSPQLAVAATLNNGSAAVGPRAPATPIEHPSSPIGYSTPPPAAEPSPFPSPPQVNAQQSCPPPPLPPTMLPPHNLAHGGDVASPISPATPISATAAAAAGATAAPSGITGAAAPPAQVENCAEMMPCFVLKERILKYGRHIDLAALCNELVHRAVCHGNPWDPNDWTVPDDLFERFPGLR